MAKELTNAKRRVARNTAKAAKARKEGRDASAINARVEADAPIVAALEQHLATIKQGHDETPAPVLAPAVTEDPVPGVIPEYDPATAPEGPATLNYLRRKGTSTAHGNFGMDFGQDIEPAGRYMTQGTMQPHLDYKDWEGGTITFQNPLRIEFGDDLYTEPGNWKQVLHRKYGGKKGKALSRAIAKDGHDAIITWTKYGTSEIVDLTSFAADAPKPAAKKKATTAPRTGDDLAKELKAEYPGLILDLHAPSKGGTSEWTNLRHIELPKAARNSGAGTAIMERIIKEADANGWSLALTPDGAFGGSKTRLEKFYRRFGFVPNKGRNKDYTTQEAMIRPASK